MGDADGVAGGNEVLVDISVCVPRTGFADVNLSAPVTSPIYGDPTSEETVGLGRGGGVLVSRIYLSGQVGAACNA
jgi:hypothetical protein